MTNHSSIKSSRHDINAASSIAILNKFDSARRIMNRFTGVGSSRPPDGRQWRRVWGGSGDGARPGRKLQPVCRHLLSVPQQQHVADDHWVVPGLRGEDVNARYFLEFIRL